MEAHLTQRAHERRVAQAPHGSTSVFVGRVLADPQLHGLYSEATTILLRAEIVAEDLPGWAHAIRLLDELELLYMARVVRDPHPFVPLLQILLRMRAIEDSPELRAAQEHLVDIAQELLTAHGCSKVRPLDLINRPLPIVDALRTYGART